MIRKILGFIPVILYQVLMAQNLAPNPSFETITSCPPGNSGISGGYAPPWNRPPGSITTPDLFHSCGTVGINCNNINVPGNNYGGVSAAFDGVAYAGILTYYTACPNCREYIHAPLVSAMVAGNTYDVRMRVKLAPLSRYATDRFGIHLSNTAPNQPSNQPILLTPTWQYPGVHADKTNWVLMKFSYVAAGGEAYITAGNFYNNASTTITDFGSSAGLCALVTSGNIYYIDSIYVGTTILDQNEILLSVEESPEGALLQWSMPHAPAGSTFVLERARAGQTMEELTRSHPEQPGAPQFFTDKFPLLGNSFYRLRCLLPDGSEVMSSTEAYYSVTGDASRFRLLAWPDPAEDEVSISLLFDGNPPAEALIQLVNVEGEVVLEETTAMEARLDVRQMGAGIYVLRAFAGGEYHSLRLLIR
jgi:hypothetical protein